MPALCQALRWCFVCAVHLSIWLEGGGVGVGWGENTGLFCPGGVFPWGACRLLGEPREHLEDIQGRLPVESGIELALGNGKHLTREGEIQIKAAAAWLRGCHHLGGAELLPSHPRFPGTGPPSRSSWCHSPLLPPSTHTT